MMILVLPMLSAREINADSNYVILRQVIPRIVARNPDWHFVILWPSNNADWQYFDDGFFRSKNVSRHPMHFDPNKMIQVVSFDPRAWEKLIDYKRGIWDVVWINSVERGGLVKGYEHHFSPSAMPVVVNFHHYVLHKSLNYPVKTYEHVVLAQLAGALCVPTNVVNSEHCRAMLLDNAREYLSVAQASRVEKSIQKISYGTLTDDDLKLQQPRHDVFTFAFNHRLQDYKQWRKTFELFDMLWSIKRGKFAVQVHASIASDHIGDIASRPYVRVVHAPTREDYIRSLSKCHANVTNSLHETFGIAAVESMAFGQVLVAPNGVTFPEITGRSAGNSYPFLFDSEDAQFKMMSALVGDRTLDTWGAVARDHVLEHYSAAVTARNVSSLFASLAHKDVLSGLKRRREWEALIGSRPRWNIDELRMKAYGSANDAGGNLAADQSFPVIKIKRLANELGYVDDYAGGILSVRKGETK